MMITPRLIAVAFAIASVSGGSAAEAAPCPPTGTTRADLLKLKASKFAIPSDEERNSLALRLVGCLEDPDPAIRDGVAFESLSTWLRGKALSTATITALEASLSGMLRSGEKDKGGFRLPFAALVLSEVARTDRIEPQFTDAVRGGLVETAAMSLIAVNDYRGFDPVEGWRHGVAHGSDLVLQLALNPRVGASGLARMMEAVATQVAPRGATFYTFGEPERLARAVVFANRRGLLDAAFWEGWFAGLTSPKPFNDWGAAFRSVDGLAKRHNTLAFLHALSFAGRSGGDEAGKTIAALADKAVGQLGS